MVNQVKLAKNMLRIATYLWGAISSVCTLETKLTLGLARINEGAIR